MDLVTRDMKERLSPASSSSLIPTSSSSLNPSSHRTDVTADTNTSVSREIFQTEISHLVDLKIKKEPVNIKIHNTDDETKIVNNLKLESPREEIKNNQAPDISNLVDLKILKFKDMKASPSTTKNKDSTKMVNDNKSKTTSKKMKKNYQAATDISNLVDLKITTFKDNNV